MRAANEQNSIALRVSERAYLSTGPPVMDISSKQVLIPINNDGKVPSGPIEAIVHEATIDLDRGSPTGGLAIEHAWKRKALGPARPGRASVVLGVPIKAAVLAKLRGGQQGIIIAGTIAYKDGFADDPTTQWLFCVETHLPIVANQLPWVECDAPTLIRKLEKTDGFPNNEDADSS